jgi:hypothetical protein
MIKLKYNFEFFGFMRYNNSAQKQNYNIYLKKKQFIIIHETLHDYIYILCCLFFSFCVVRMKLYFTSLFTLLLVFTCSRIYVYI